MTHLLAPLALAAALLAAGPAAARIVFFPVDRGPLPQLEFRLGDTDAWLIPAQTKGEEGYDYEDDDDPVTPGKALNKGFTRQIVRILLHANETCDDPRIELRYRVDCIRVYYGWAADALPDRGDYAPIKKALREAEKKLAAIVSANIDRSAPVITPREGHKPAAKKLPPLRAVKKSSAKKVAKKAEAVVKETELVILRSGEDPSRREEHFDAVAEAVDSNLVILRSA